MSGSQCQACIRNISTTLTVRHGNQGEPMGVCRKCHSLTCGHHGERETATQQFRCVECFPSLVSASAAAASATHNATAQEMIAGEPAWAALPFGFPNFFGRIDNPEAFLDSHDLRNEETTLADFFRHSALSFERRGERADEPIYEDLLEIYRGLERRGKADLLLLAACSIRFVFPSRWVIERLPAYMRVLGDLVIRR